MADLTDWRDDALCSQIGGDLWFPELDSDNGAIAKRMCARCPVQADCLEYAVATKQRFGIWGGKNERERRPLLKEHAHRTEAAV